MQWNVSGNVGEMCVIWLGIDHGKSDELGYRGELEKIARFEKLKEFCNVFQNGLAFQGQIGKASISEFREIYR